MKLPDLIQTLFRQLALAAFVTTAFASCSSTPKYDPSQSQFLQQANRLGSHEDVPFKRSWRSEDLDWSRYNQVQIEPVSLEHLKHPQAVEADSHRRAAREEAAELLAQFAKDEFTSAFQKDKQKRFRVVDGPVGSTVVCEIAITEFIPAKPLVNAAATGLGLAGSAMKEVAMNAGGTVAKSTSRGVIAIEVQFKDARSGKPIFMFGDRERGRPSLVNIKDFQKLGHAKAHLRTWAKQTLAVINKKPNQKILDPLPVDLKPW